MGAIALNREEKKTQLMKMNPFVNVKKKLNRKLFVRDRKFARKRHREIAKQHKVKQQKAKPSAANSPTPFCLILMGI